MFFFIYVALIVKQESNQQAHQVRIQSLCSLYYDSNGTLKALAKAYIKTKTRF